MSKPLRPHSYNFSIEVQSERKLDRGQLERTLRQCLSLFVIQHHDGAISKPRVLLRSVRNLYAKFVAAHERYRQRTLADEREKPRILHQERTD